MNKTQHVHKHTHTHTTHLAHDGTTVRDLTSAGGVEQSAFVYKTFFKKQPVASLSINL